MVFKMIFCQMGLLFMVFLIHVMMKYNLTVATNEYMLKIDIDLK